MSTNRGISTFTLLLGLPLYSSEACKLYHQNQPANGCGKYISPEDIVEKLDDRDESQGREDNGAIYHMPDSPKPGKTTEQHGHGRRIFEFLGIELLSKGANLEFATQEA